MKAVYALVDCNNFYASCERLFQPQLKYTPIVVLSNNDGCVVARSAEAKALGIPMAAPLFKVRALLEKHQVRVFSSNYTLYADISSRVMRTLEELCPSVEIYSIDEAFLDLRGQRQCRGDESLDDLGQHIRRTVYQHVGVPVCVGIAPTKTLAKLANHAAKRYPATNGVVDLTAQERQQKLLALTAVEHIWGIGKRSAEKLHQQGIHTALQLAQMDPQRAKRSYSVLLARTILELNGESCIALDEAPANRQQLICSRSFAEKMTDYGQLREVVCEFAARVSERLRHARQVARRVQVFIRTSPFDASEACYANAASGELAVASADSRDIVHLAIRLFDSLWKADYRYAKAGVMLSELSAAAAVQPGLFDSEQRAPYSQQLMTAMDTINSRGRAQVWLGAQRPDKDWFMSRDHLSPAYTTRWDSLPEIN